MADKSQSRRGLGRGLSALMADVAPAQQSTDEPMRRRGDMFVPIEQIDANPDQPRRLFRPEDLEELAASIRAKGVLQPLIVRKNPKKTENYEIVAGERRWRAAQMAQLHQLPVLIRDYTDAEVLEIAIIENVQRADLNPVEEATGYRQLMDRFGHTQEKLAEALSKSRSHIANLMRLLQLPDDVLEMVRNGDLSAGHARALITTENPSELAKRVVAKGLSVRETEQLAKGPKPATAKSAQTPRSKDADTIAIEQDLSANLKMKVQINHAVGKESGQVTISYQNMDELDEVCRILSAADRNVFR
ncbi:MAG: ParB/RepB/Spo0J family partition protein [Paracoccaceae bacterium]